MSRHRYYQNAEENYSDEEDYSYGSSYGTSYSEDGNLSTSVEKQYLFKRDQSGTTPKMSSFFATQISSTSLPEEAEFEMDLEVGGPSTSRGAEAAFEMDLETRPEEESPAPTRSMGQQLSRKNSGFDTSGLSPEEMIKLNSGLDYILDIVGDTMQEYVVKESLVKHNFEADKALSSLLSAAAEPKSSGANSANKTNQRPKPATVVTSPLRTLSSAANAASGAAIGGTPVIALQSTKATVSVGFDAPVLVLDNKPLERTKGAAVAAGGAGGGNQAKRSRSNSPLPSKLDQLNIQGSVTPGTSPPTTSTPLAVKPSLDASSTSTPFKQVVMRKEKVNVVEEFKKDRGSGKEVLNLVVIGHVDSGKSTLMGHLLFKLGNVSQKLMHKYEKESKKIGKQSFMFAWVLDETDEERNRGITMDVGQHKFETERRMVTLLDAPGHRDFIPNMISGAYQADVAVLVVNATTGEFEAGFESGGQTREHALLVRSLGVSQLVVAVNKLDTVEWSQQRFTEVKNKLQPFLTKQAGFRERDLTFVPCSGLTGENLVEAGPATAHLASWYTGTTLIQAIDSLNIPERPVEKPFRMSISDVFKGQSTGFTVAGRVESGFVIKEDKVLCSPLNQICQVKGVLVEQLDSLTGYAGDHVTLVLTGPDQFSVTPGMVLCDPALPVPVTDKFQARIVVFNIDVPITKGFPVVLHYGCVSEQATVKKLISLLNKSTGELVKSKPRCLTGNCSAVVDILVSKPLPLELYKDNRELGRFMLRTGGHTIAAGMITSLP